MKAICTECGHVFLYKDAVCEDWSDENRRFGCPRCGMFFRKLQDVNRVQSWTRDILMSGVFLPACFILGLHLTDGDAVTIGLSVFILCSLAAIEILRDTKLLHVLEPNGLRSADISDRKNGVDA